VTAWLVAMKGRKVGVNSVGPRTRLLEINISSANTREEAIGIATAIVTPNYSVIKVLSCEEATL
jgi:hypothetical protein